MATFLRCKNFIARTLSFKNCLCLDIYEEQKKISAVLGQSLLLPSLYYKSKIFHDLCINQQALVMLTIKLVGGVYTNGID